ncbi:MAG: GntR family transcriptional regulator [Anaerolineales bacterium]
MSTLDITLNFRSGLPIYIQIMNQIKHKIAAKELKPGDQLPTVRQLAADLRVNFNTIARAYRTLDNAGIISTQHGRGTFIPEHESEEKSEKMRHEDLMHLTLRYLNDTEHLGFPPQKVQEIITEKINQRKFAIAAKVRIVPTST